MPPSEDSEPLSLQHVLKEHGIELPADSVDLLDRYRQLLWEWNEKLNLTRHTTLELFVGRDVLDSMMLADQLGESEKVLDVGTGGGVPGVIVHILRPDVTVELLDKTEKKIRAVTDILEKLALPIQAHHDRLPEFLQPLPERSYHTLLVRAVAPLPKFLPLVHSQWGKFGRLLIVKGPKWKAECDEARDKKLTKRLQIRKLDEYRTPGTDVESFIIEVKPTERDWV